MAAADPGSGDRKRPWLWLAATGVVLLHLALTQWFLPLSAVLGAEPLKGDDFDVHVGQTWRVVEGLQKWGKSWVYDPKLLAGQPEGTIFDGDNKGWELWTFAAVSLGVPRPIAFNSFVLAAFLAWPALAFIGARLFGFSAAAGLLAAAFCSLSWFFDSFAHWVWWVGMIEYAIGTCFAVVPLGLFYRFVRAPSFGRAAGTAVALGVGLVLHPYAFFILVVPMGLLYLGAARGLARRDHALVVGIAAVAIAINLYWLLPAFAHWHYVQDSGFYAQAGPAFLIADFFDVLRDPSDTGVIGTRTGFRFLYLAAAAACLYFWRRERDPRFVPFAAVLGVCFVLSYFGPLVPYARQIQPYRHALPLVFFSAIAAAFWITRLFAERALRGAPKAVYALLAVLGLATVQHLGIEIAYFTPQLVPEAKPLFDGTPSPIMRYGFLSWYKEVSHLPYALPRDDQFDKGSEDAIAWIERNVPLRGRVLCDDFVLGERLAWKTHVEVLGGFELRNIRHAYANFFRRYGKRKVPTAELAEYLKTYAVDLVVLHRPRADFDRETTLLEPLPIVGERIMYRTKISPSKVLSGHGTVYASTNRIAVWNSKPDEDVVLSYHWHEQLRCIPRCSVRREPHRLDDVGFIRVPAPHPTSFVVKLEY